MKRYVTIIALLLSIEVQAEILDSTQFVAFYRYILQTQDDMEQDVSDSIRLALLVGTRATECTTVLDYERDASPCQEMTNVFLTHIPFVLTNIEKSKVISRETLYPYRYETHETVADVDWKLINDTLMINGFRCLRATGKLYGKQWTVWYTKDICSSAGPWKLRGLPGLVVKAIDAEGVHCFELYETRKERKFISYIEQPDYKKLSRKKFVKLKNKALDNPRYAKEPTYYVEKQPDDVVEIDYDGVLYYVANHIIIPQKAHVYQPLELE